jgi:LPS sulfotransferase NodH
MRGEVFGEKFLPLTSQNDQTDENRIVFLRQFWARYKRSGQATIARGFKVQINPGQPQFTAWDRLPAVMDEHHAKLIVIRRTNIVKQAISAIRARDLMKLTKLATGRERGHIDRNAHDSVRGFAEQPTRIDLADLRGVIRSIENSRSQLTEIAKLIPPACEVTYEDYLSDRARVVNSIFETIGVPVTMIGEPAFSKITSDDLSVVVTNYDEVRKVAEQIGCPV